MESASIPVPGGGAGAHEHEHHGPPEAHASSRIDRQTLGILIFIVSEIMLFGAFFASYFFLRVVANEGPWPPEGIELPVAVACVNTCDPGRPRASRSTGRSRGPARATAGRCRWA